MTSPAETRARGAAALIVADDLTGALDSAAPFAALGFKTCVARDAVFIADALAQAPDVLSVSTNSRHAAPGAAAAAVEAVAQALRGERVGLVFKKIDSRMKGNVAAETEAALAAFGAGSALVCPAIPDLGRIVAGGRVAGAGAQEGIPIADALGDLRGRCVVADAASEDDLDALARDSLTSRGARLPVGARGLAAAVARALAGREARSPAPDVWTPRPALLAIASRDPVARAQVAAFLGERPATPAARWPREAVRFDWRGADCCLALIDDEEAISAAALARYAQAVAAEALRARPETLVVSGGETAAAILEALGAGTLEVFGEALPGLPASRLVCEGRAFTLVTKSGGFGGEGTLAELLSASAPSGVIQR